MWLVVTILLALASETRVSAIGFLDIRHLIKHSSGYAFHFGKNTETSKRSKPRNPIKFDTIKKSLSVCRCIDLYIKGTEEMRGQNSQFLSSFVKPNGTVLTSTISRWIMIVLSLFGIDTKTFTGHLEFKG